MTTATRRVRARNARPRKLFRPGAAPLEDRVLLAVGDVLTYHNTVTPLAGQLPGVDSTETTLTPSNVNPTGFGKLFTDPVDGYVYAQPLYVSGVNIQGTLHDV